MHVYFPRPHSSVQTWRQDRSEEVCFILELNMFSILSFSTTVLVRGGRSHQSKESPLARVADFSHLRRWRLQFYKPRILETNLFDAPSNPLLIECASVAFRPFFAPTFCISFSLHSVHCIFTLTTMVEVEISIDLILLSSSSSIKASNALDSH